MNSKALENRGFTLIEILVVMTIIGITIGFTMLAFGDFGAKRRIETEAEQLQQIFRVAQQQAILESATFGLRINNRSWQFLRFKPPANWTAVSKRHVFKEHRFPKNMQILLKTPFKPRGNQPDILIDASGSITPFTMEIGTAGNPDLLIFTGQQNGHLSLKRGSS